LRKLAHVWLANPHEFIENMQMPISEADLSDFTAFARQYIDADQPAPTIAELAQLWQAARQRAEVNAAIHEGLKAIDDGRTRPFVDSQDEFRRSRNLPPRT
jgi:hypothetical protein